MVRLVLGAGTLVGIAAQLGIVLHLRGCEQLRRYQMIFQVSLAKLGLDRNRTTDRFFSPGPQRVARGLSFHVVQEENLLLGRHLGDVVFVVATRIERPIERLRPVPQRIAVRGIGRWHGRHRFC